MDDSLGDTVGTDITAILKGKEYKFSRLDLDDMAEFEEYIRRNRLRQYHDIFADADASNRAKMVMEILNTPLSTLDLIAEVDTMSGSRFMLWRSLQKNHREIELSNMGDLIDIDNLKEVRPILIKIGLVTAVPPVKGAEESPSTGSSASLSSLDTTGSPTGKSAG